MQHVLSFHAVIKTCHDSEIFQGNICKPFFKLVYNWGHENDGEETRHRQLIQSLWHKPINIFVEIECSMTTVHGGAYMEIYFVCCVVRWTHAFNGCDPEHMRSMDVIRYIVWVLYWINWFISQKALILYVLGPCAKVIGNLIYK